MKTVTKLIIIVSSSTLALMPISCQSNERQYHERLISSTDASYHTVDDMVSPNIVVEVKRDVPTVLPLDTVHAPVVTDGIVPEEATLVGPSVYANSVFDDNLLVDPWRANYVGSYGVLPTRQPGNGPFWYSLPVSPDADVFNDDDGPRPIYEEELFWRGDDDDDEF